MPKIALPRLLAAASVGALLLTGCSSRTLPTTPDATGASSSPGSTADASPKSSPPPALTAPTELPVTKAISGTIPKSQTVAFIFSGTDQTKTFDAGLKDATAALGWTLQNFTYDPVNPATLQSAVDSAVAAKPAAILTVALNNAQLTPIVAAAKAANIPLISARTSAAPADGFYPMWTNSAQMGHVAKLSAAQLVSDSEATGKPAHVLELAIPEFQEALGVFQNEMKAALAKCNGCTHEVLNVSLADVFAGKTSGRVAGLLQTKPDINYIFSDAAQLTVGLDAALQQTGKSDVPVYGAVPTAAQLDPLLKGAPGAWGTIPLRVEAWAMVDLAARVLSGDTSNPWKDAHLGYLITKDNVQGVDTKEPAFPVGYQDMFKKLWGAK